MSAWDEVDSPEVAKGAAQAGQVDDGLGDSRTAELEPGHVVDDVDMVVKKGKVNPRVIAAILGVAVVGFLGYAGNNVYQRMAKAKARPATTEQVKYADVSTLPVNASDAVDGSKQPTTIMDHAPAASVAQTTNPQTGAMVGVAAAAPVTVDPATAQQAVVALPAATPSQVATAPVMLAPPAATPDPHVQDQIEQHAKRLSSIETALAKLNDQAVRRERAAPQKMAKARPVVVAKTARTKPSKDTEVANQANPSGWVTEAVAPGRPAVIETDLPAFRLRGVFPPQGEDRQAWVLDSKTGAISVVSRGAFLQGMRVVSVESDHVTTDRGVIR